MTQTVQALFLDSRRCKDSVISLAEIHRPSVVAMLVWHQWRVLSEVRFFPQVPNHGDCRVVQRHGPFAGGRLQLAHFHIPARLGLEAIPAPDLFYATLQVENPALQVDVAVEQAQQLSRPQSCVEHENVGRRLLVFAFAICEGGEGFLLEFGNLRGGEYGDGFLLWHTLFVLGGKEIRSLHHGDGLHGVLLDEIFLGQVAEILVEEDVHFLHGGVGVTLLHPMVQHGFQVGGGDVPHDFVPDEREHLALQDVPVQQVLQ